MCVGGWHAINYLIFFPLSLPRAVLLWKGGMGVSRMKFLRNITKLQKQVKGATVKQSELPIESAALPFCALSSCFALEVSDLVF